MIRRSFFFSFAQKYSQLAFRTISLVVLARLLTPEDFGVFATGQAIIHFITVLAEFGMTRYLIQEKDLTPEREGTVLGISLIATLLTCIGVYLAVGFYRGDFWDDQMAMVVGILGLNLVLQPVSLPAMAMLQREMRFDTLFYVGLFKAAANVGVAILLAWMGYGFLALAWGLAAEQFVATLFAVGVLRRYPLRRPTLKAWREVFNFGKLITGIGLLHEFGLMSTMVVGGKFLGDAAVGLLSRGQAITSMFDRIILQAVSPVILPALSKAAREGRDLKPLYMTKLAFLSVAAWPFFLFVALFAEPLVHVVLGDKWAEAVPVVRILAASGVFLPFIHLSIQFIIICGTLDVFMRRLAVAEGLRLCLTIGLAQISLTWLAAGLIVDAAVKAYVMQKPIKMKLGYRRAEVWGAMWPSLVVTALCGVAMLPVAYGLAQHGDWVRLVAGAGACGAAWVGAALLVHPQVKGELVHLVGAVRRRLSRRDVPAALG
ncbi:oligosaccharide flippase family protein [Aerophototrophica crusticola]|uniref:Oligosaccharide flippase family protein n=1 Tax=Aerophototrophica crusticola TaxID=1709002 RepID=A0A858R8M9_9PROT|nr:oligosaccharide flippase family protein [Rhodospirillaceae bacterium B3]